MRGICAQICVRHTQFLNASHRKSWNKKEFKKSSGNAKTWDVKGFCRQSLVSFFFEHVKKERRWYCVVRKQWTMAMFRLGIYISKVFNNRWFAPYGWIVTKIVFKNENHEHFWESLLQIMHVMATTCLYHANCVLQTKCESENTS